jgi:stage V sporulation protein D (sporulation-specific penicillin-binding protein)
MTRYGKMNLKVSPTSMRWKHRCLTFIAGFLGVSLLTAVFLEQTYYRDSLLNRIDSKWTAYYEVPPRRGAIRARNGSILAISEKRFNVVVDPGMLGNDKITAQILSRELDLDFDSLVDEIASAKESGNKYLPIKKRLSQAEMIRVHTLNLKGVFIEESYSRYYPYKDQMSPYTIGFVRERDSVMTQSESAFDSLLTGIPGLVYYQRDKRWGRIPGTELVDREVVHGRDIYLTLDESIQTVCETELDLAMDEYRPDWGLVAVMDPYTGEILADAVRPTFDPNECVSGGTVGSIAANPLYGFIVEPGSVIKPIIVAGALQLGAVKVSQKFYCPSSLKVKNIVITEAKKGTAYGTITLDTAVIKSSNVYMAQLGMQLGLNRLMKILDNAMLLEKPGLGMPTEAKGLQPEHAVRDKRGQYPEVFDTDEATAAFGQGIAMTPIALLTAYAELANGGYPVQPKIILGSAKDIGGIVGEVDRKSAGYVAYSIPNKDRQKRKRLYSDATVEAVRKMMIDAVHTDAGTGKKARLASGLTVAGKTGTAEVHSKYGGYAKGKYLSSFAGFFPAEKPKYVVLVMFMAPKGKYYGGEISAPVFRKVSDRICYLDRISPVVYAKGGHDA